MLLHLLLHLHLLPLQLQHALLGSHRGSRGRMLVGVAVPVLVLPASTLERHQSGLVKRPARTQDRATTTEQHFPACSSTICGDISPFSAIGGAHGTGSAGVPGVALSRFQLFAPPGAGRVRAERPALGSLADVAPLERPG